MIANNLTPYEPVHPGELLKEEIEYRGISQRKLSAEIGVCYSVLNEILNCKRPVSTIARKDGKIINRFNEIRKLAVFL